MKYLKSENRKQYEKDQITASIDISISQYEFIGTGVVKPTVDQTGRLGAHYGIDPKHILVVSDNINYNIGTYSRTIYARQYYEGSEDKPKED